MIIRDAKAITALLYMCINKYTARIRVWLSTARSNSNRKSKMRRNMRGTSGVNAIGRHVLLMCFASNNVPYACGFVYFLLATSTWFGACKYISTVRIKRLDV